MTIFKKLMDLFRCVKKHDDNDECYVVTVEKGDTLWGIAEDMVGDGRRWVEMQPLNPGMDDRTILRPGDDVVVPRSWLWVE